jgi:predicted aspartyl protease
MPSFTARIAELTGAGPVLEILISRSKYVFAADESTAEKVIALIDTGAECTVVKPEVIQKLGLRPIGVVSVLTPTSKQEERVQCYQ